MWDLPGPGLKPVSPALAGGFLTTAPPGKSIKHLLKYLTYVVSNSYDYSIMWISVYIFYSSKLSNLSKFIKKEV